MNIAAVTNDIFTKEDGEFLTKHDALPAERIRAVETSGCPPKRTIASPACNPARAAAESGDTALTVATRLLSKVSPTVSGMGMG